MLPYSYIFSLLETSDGALWVGLHVFSLTIPQFAIVNLVLALVWLVVAILIGREYPRLVRQTPRPTYSRQRSAA